MIGVGLIDLIDEMQIGRPVLRQPRRRRKDLENALAHQLPHGLQPPGNRRRRRIHGRENLPRLERIALPDVVPGGLHRRENFIGDLSPANAAERPGKPPGDRRMTAIQQAAQHVGSIADARERDLRLDRVTLKEAFRHPDQRRRRREQPQALPVHKIGL